MIRFLCLAVVVGLTAAATRANEVGNTHTTRQLLVVLAPAEPLLIDLDIWVGGEQGFAPIGKAWRDGARKDFHRLDTNQDDTLARDELAKAVWKQQSANNASRPSALARFFSNLTGSSQAAPQPAAGKDFAEFVEVRRRDMPPVELKRQATGGDRRNRLWKLVEASGDQRLDAVERIAMPQRMERVDLNGDGLLQEMELYALDNPFSLNVRANKLPPRDVRWVAWPAAGARPEQWREVDQIAEQLMRKYDLEKRPEFLQSPLWGALAREHDADADGRLQLDEWQSLLRSPAVPVAVHCQVRLHPSRPNYTVVVNGRPQLQQGKPNRLLLADLPPWETEQSHQTHARIRSAVKLRVNKNSIHVVGSGMVLRLQTGTNAFDQLSNALRSFDNVVDKAKGYLEQEEANRQFPLNQLFVVADADDDGMLYRDELEQCVTMLREHAGQSAAVTVQDRGRQLFDLLDSNGDSVVDKLERESASVALREYDQDGDGDLQPDELPQCCTIQFNIGSPKVLSQYYPQSIGLTASPRSTDASAPEWFRLLDRNADNLVERAEYPGKAERFQQLDQNRDGRLSLEEAAASNE